MDNCIEIWKGHNVFVVKVTTACSGLGDLLAESSLGVWKLSQCMEYMSQCSSMSIAINIRVPEYLSIEVW